MSDDSKRARPRPRTTVICAVWHRDPLREARLRRHKANLDAQSTPVECIYVFDGNDDVGTRYSSLGQVATIRGEITIHQAWNVALALVTTPYVMHLSLDDRYNGDAVALYEAALDSEADMVCGDWRVCYSQEETDAVSATSCGIADVPFIADWPPKPGTRTRLGVGGRERGTLGPGCAWRASLGLFPTHFRDGTPIRTIGDLLFWESVKERRKTIVRLPRVVGNYFSHPEDQAEFRHPVETELDYLQRVGL